MAPQNAPSKPSSPMLVTGVVLFYLVAALAMVVANKWVLNATSTPLFFLWCQLAIAALLFLVSDFLRLLPDRLTFDLKTCRGLVPMVGLNVLGLSFSNYTLKYVDASFYQIARGLVLPFTVLISTYSSHLSLSSHPSPRPSLLILLACTLVTLGFFTGVLLDGTALSLVGISFGVASSLITATHSVVIKQSLGVVGGSALALSWYTNALSAVVLAPLLVLAGEGGGVVQLLFGEPERVTADRLSPLATFLWGSAITGVLGFMMSIASLLSIKVTSPITHMVSSAVRGVAASLLGVWLFHDIITTGRASSIAIILLGSIFYTWVKHQESQAASNGNGLKPSTTSRRGSREYERLKMDDVEAGIREKEKQ